MNSAEIQLNAVSLRERRRALGLSLQALAAHSGLSQGRLSLLERDQGQPEEAEQVRLEQILGPGVVYGGPLDSPSSLRAFTFRGSAPQTSHDWVRLAALLTHRAD